MSDATTNDDDDDMRDEYDLEALGPGVVGKYYDAYQAWKKRNIVLDPDVAKEFPDADSVNRTLRRVAKARHHRLSRSRTP